MFVEVLPLYRFVRVICQVKRICYKFRVFKTPTVYYFVRICNDIFFCSWKLFCQTLATTKKHVNLWFDPWVPVSLLCLTGQIARTRFCLGAYKNSGTQRGLIRTLNATPVGRSSKWVVKSNRNSELGILSHSSMSIREDSSRLRKF